MATLATDMRARLSLLWVFVMLNMFYADVLSFMKRGDSGRTSWPDTPARSRSPPTSCSSRR